MILRRQRPTVIVFLVIALFSITTEAKISLEKYKAMCVKGLHFYHKYTPSVIPKYPKTFFGVTLGLCAGYLFYDNNRDSIFVWSVKNHYWRLADFMLARGVYVETLNGGSRTPLLRSVLNNNIESVKYLMMRGANCEKENAGRIPIAEANNLKDKTIYKYLLGKQFIAAVNNKDFEKAKKLLFKNGNYIEKNDEDVKKACDLFDKYMSSLEEKDKKSEVLDALSRGDLDQVRYFIEKKLVDVNAKIYNGTPLTHATISGQLEIVKYLIEKGANLKAQDILEINKTKSCLMTPLEIAKKDGTNKELIRYLAEQEFVWAIKEEDYNSLESLFFENDIDLTVKIKDGKTLLDLFFEKSKKNAQKFVDKVLVWYTKKGDLEKVKYFIETWNAGIEAKDDNTSKLLITAAENKHIEIIKYLVNKSITDSVFKNYNCRRRHYEAVLEYAVLNNDFPLIQYLVDKGIENGANSDFFDPALRLSAENGNREAVEYLINKGVSLNWIDKFNNDAVSILMLVAQKGNLEMLRCLIYNGVDVDAIDRFGHNALYYVKGKHSHEIVRELLANNATIIDDGYSSSVELLKKYVREIKEITDYKNAVNNNEKDALVKAITNNGSNNSVFTKEQWLTLAFLNNHNNQIRYAIESNCIASRDITDWENKRKRMPDSVEQKFIRALEEKKYEYAELLFFKKNADLTAKIKNDEKTLLDLFFEKSEKTAKEFVNKALLWFTEKGDLERVKYFIETGNGDIEMQDTDECTPIIIASKKGYLEIVEYLIKKGADTEKCGRIATKLEKNSSYHFDTVYYCTALTAAVWYGHPKIAHYLAENKANLEGKKNDDLEGKNFTYYYSPLYIAVKKGNLEIAKYLTGKKLNLDSKNGKWYRTPLIRAVKNGDLNMVKLLINHGANIEEKDNLGHSALYLALLRGHHDIIRELLANNATIPDDDNFLRKYAREVKEITDYKNAVQKSEKDALEKAITKNGSNDSVFTKEQWLTLALLNKHYDQIEYAVDQKILTSEDIVDLLTLRPHLSIQF